jgi:hypothetical protein
VVLRPAVGGIRKFLGITALAVFWNGITGTFVALVADDWRSGDPSYFATLFLIPFVLIGLGLLLAVPHHFLALFGPRPRFTLTPGVVGLGSAATLQWSIRGPSSAMRGLQISLEGREEATYSRGTTSTTDQRCSTLRRSPP